MGNEWRDCYSRVERSFSEKSLAPENFMKANGVVKFRYGKENVEMIMHICKTGRKKPEYPKMVAGTYRSTYPPHHDEIPYIDHAYFYKTSTNAAFLVYHPYIQYKKPILDMAMEIVKFWKSVGMNAWVLRESWYNPDALLVMVSYPYSWMSAPMFEYDVPGFYRKSVLSFWNQFTKEGSE